MSMMQTALDYARRGWAVFPVSGIVDNRCTCGSADCHSPGKHPLFSGGFNIATTDENTIRGWWSNMPDANIGIATGEPSGIFVVDVDVGNGKRGEQSLAELEQKVGQLPTDAVVRTGSGGLHYYFELPPEPIRNSASRLGENIDVRGNGGYVIAPPSKHISGNAYIWENINV